MNESMISNLKTPLLTIALDLPWFELLGKIWKIGRKIIRGWSNEGMYEVLDYESTLEVKDNRGEKAIIRKREKVRYLQDNIIAYQDQAWGDGEILLGYKCTPGKPVDRYMPGKKTYILISLQEVKSKGDVDEFNIEWGIRKGFVREKEQWETEIRHRTRRLRVQLIFPKSRPPLNVILFEGKRQRTYTLDESSQVRLPDGRWMVSWEKDRPKLYERYILRWEW